MENKLLLDMWICPHTPAKLSVLHIESLNPLQSIEYLVVWVLDGQVDTVVNHKKRRLGKNGIVIVNPLDHYHLSGNGLNTVMLLSLGRIPLSSDVTGAVLEAEGADAGRGEQLRTILANILSTALEKQPNGGVLLESYVPAIWYELLSGFVVCRDKSHLVSSGTERIDTVRQYILQNYAQAITLEDAANIAYLSPAYLSRLFKQTCGISFYSYLVRVRLSKAVELLLSTEESIGRIAFQCGFPSERSFRQALAAAHGQTPGELRTTAKRRNIPKSALPAKQEVFDQTLIRAYQNQGVRIEARPLQLNRPLTVDMEASGPAFRHSWKTLMGCGYAYELLNQNLREQVSAFAKSGGFTHLMLTGIFHEDLLIYREDANGVSCGFQHLDDIIDFCYSNGLKPFINLCYLPQALASTEHTLVRKGRNHYTSPPKDISKWNALVENLITHLLHRYGQDQVCSWYFETWATPEMKVFWDGTIEQYYHFYLETYRTVRRYLPDGKIGGPGFISSNIAGTGMLEEYVRFCMDNNVVPDFLSFHIYPISFGQSGETEKSELTAFNQEYSQQFSQYEWLQRSFEERNISTPEDYMTTVLDDIEKRVGALLSGVELFATEWNSSPAPFHGKRDTCYQSAYIAKTVSETFDRLSGLNYWFCSDIYEGYRSGTNLFHGGRGVFCGNGLRKVSFHVFDLLAGLGDTLLDRGEGYLITKKSGGALQMLLYNYIHSADGDHRSGQERHLRFDLNLLGGSAPSYRVYSKILNEKHGNPYGLWKDMGAPGTLSAEELQYLSRKAVPLETIHIQQPEGPLRIEAVLEPQEVRFLEVTPYYDPNGRGIPYSVNN